MSTTNTNPSPISNNVGTQVSYDYVTAIKIVPAFVHYLLTNFSSHYVGVLLNQNDTSITVDVELSQVDLTTLTTLVNNYLDPSFFYQLTKVDNFPMMTNYTNSTSLLPVGSLIYSNSNSNTLVMNQIKLVVALQCNDTIGFTNTSTGDVTFELIDKTRNVIIVPETVINVNSILNSWHENTAENTTGYPSNLLLI